MTAATASSALVVGVRIRGRRTANPTSAERLRPVLVAVTLGDPIQVVLALRTDGLVDLKLECIALTVKT